MSGDMIGAAITFGALGALVVSVLGATGMYEKDGPLAKLFRNIRDGLVAGWLLLRNTFWSLTHQSPPRKPYLSADTVEELEIECYIGPYAEPFRAESLKAYRAKKARTNGVRVIPSCERNDEVPHLYAWNSLCVRCGVSKPASETAARDRKIRDDAWLNSLTHEEFIAEMDSRMYDLRSRIETRLPNP